MNAAQRRKAYRKIASMVGRKAVWKSSTGRTMSVKVIGKTGPVAFLACTPICYNNDGFRPSVHRVIVHRDSNVSTDSTFGAKISQMRFVK